MRFRYLFLLLIVGLLVACGGGNRSIQVAADQQNVEVVSAANEESQQQEVILSESAKRLDSLGYVNIQGLDSTIEVEMIYATSDNFVGEVLYDDLTEAYLLPEAAEKLVKAHQLLKEKHPEYRFVVYDAARPMSVQKRMWEVAKKNGWSHDYVANPAKGGGLHNYGAAVDLTILDENGVPLSMGTAFDYFGKEAHTDKEQELVAEGKITEQELANRLLLRSVMKEAGFTSISSEWWHFNHCSRKVAVEKYQLIE
ncbi:MAG: M15 family metallopeptidase [Prevotellaceae bacterium]|jgi:D-alanyl-D-alanine dipeptidase|nr:M15 family metallopeptidase [Prevotellaceae bacterium]